MTPSRSRALAGLRIVSLLTLASRVLGLVRDMAMASLFGNGPVLDAFTVAFRLPNLARRLFGEGALTAAFLPAFIHELERAGRESAWKLASAVLNSLTIVLCLLVLAGELLLGLLALVFGTGGSVGLLVGLAAVLLPYLVLICLAAQLSAVLHALGRFAAPAMMPALLNVVWICAIVLSAWRLESATARIYAITASIVLGGILQLLWLMPSLFRLGFRYWYGWAGAREKVRSIGRAMLPVVVGLSVTQLNTLSDSLIAWGFSLPRAADTTETAVAASPIVLDSGTASALYFGQRMYQFPLGIFGVALGTVLFPLLSRHAEQGRDDLLRQDLVLGLRLVTYIGLPAGAGLILLARPLTLLLFQRGAFDLDDSRQTVEMIAAYGVGVWAYCGLLIVHRAYYAVVDRQTPLRVGLCAVALNLVLNFVMLWQLGAAGLALATSITAIVQLLAASWFLQYRVGALPWRGLGVAIVRAAAATSVMAVVCRWTMSLLPSDGSTPDRLLSLFGPFAASVAAYFAAARLLGMHDVWLLFKGERPER